MRVEPMDVARVDAVRALLMEDLVPNMYLLDQLQQWEAGQSPGLRWWLGHGARGGLEGVVYANQPLDGRPALSLSAAGDEDACYRIGRALRPLTGWMMVGPRQAVDGLWEGLGCPGFRVFFDQRLYVCDAPPEGPALYPVPATREQAPLVARLQREMLEEDLGLASGRIDIPAQERRVAERVAEGRMFLLLGETGEAVFTIDGGNMGLHGTQVGGTFTVPAARGQGIATRAMRGLCRELLEEVPRVTLHVNEANGAAVRVYERSGFRPAAPFRLMSV